MNVSQVSNLDIQATGNIFGRPKKNQEPVLELVPSLIQRVPFCPHIVQLLTYEMSGWNIYVHLNDMSVV